ncbi:hypothetical protein BGZ46_004496 [Entomortierella lignicola]|nr:hypothetical protein BGZ46_004496 [Entomortierella lignicola]
MLEPVFKGLETDLKTCPRWSSFPMARTNEYSQSDGMAEVSVCYYIWNNTPVFYTNASILNMSYDRDDELYQFKEDSFEEIRELPRDLRRFLPKNPTSDIVFDWYEDLSS